MKVGTEHEFSINDSTFRPLPVNDKVLERLSGTLENEITFGGISLSKELQKHALEFKPIGPHTDLRSLERRLHRGLLKVYATLGNGYRFLGLGMHPTLELDKTTYWDHEEKEVFEAYDRIFDIKQHGWLNIQALQINFPYGSETGLVRMYNKIRALIPYLVAVTAASPMVEGKVTDTVDSRLVYYRRNQARIPSICNKVVPDTLSSVEDYKQGQGSIFEELRKVDGELLCKEWVNSSGVIVRFSRECLEIKALDEQESIFSDIAFTAFIRTLLEAGDLGLEQDRDALLETLEAAIESGTERLRPELLRLFDIFERNAKGHDRRYLDFVRWRIEEGSLGEVLREHMKRDKDITTLLERLEGCLRDNAPFQGPGRRK